MVGLRGARRVAVWSIVASVAALLPTTSASAAAAGPTFTGPGTISEAHDFASDVWADPWDYSDEIDIITDKGPTLNLKRVVRTGSTLAFSIDKAAYLSPVWGGYPGSLPLGREGANRPVDASAYDRISFAMRSSRDTTAAVFWFTCRSMQGCIGGHSFFVKQGWHVYDLPLTPNGVGGAPDPWAGDVVGVRLALNNSTNPRVDIDMELDWMRIYQQGEPVCVNSNNVDTVWWDRDTSLANNGLGSWAWGRLPVSSRPGCGHDFNASAMTPGTYRFYSIKNGAPSAYSEPLVIDGAPLPLVLDPDLAGGADYATIERGNPWDFSAPNDVASLVGAGSVSWSGGQLHATNSGNLPPAPPPYRNDPHMWMAMGPAIDADTYHRLTVKSSYDGPFGLEDAAGGGTHGRLIYTRNDTGSFLHESKELVQYRNDDTFVIDLKTTPLSALMEDDLSGQRGWDRRITGLRWDPNEDRGSRRWHMDQIALRADDHVQGNHRFKIRWSDDRHQPGSTVTIYFDNDDKDFNGVPIARVTPASGNASYTWDTRFAPPGTWWVYIVIDDGTQARKAYSTGPVVVDGKPIKPYGGFKGGAYVDGAELDSNPGNGDEMAIVPDRGGGPRLIVQRTDGTKLADFYTFAPSMKQGLKVGAGPDADGCGLVGVGTGSGITATVKAYRFCDGNKTKVFDKTPYGPGFTGGVFVKIGDIDHDGRADIVTTTGKGGFPIVKVFRQEPNGSFTKLHEFLAFNGGFKGGVRPDVADIHGNGDEILVGSGVGITNNVRAYRWNGTTMVKTEDFTPLSPSYQKGIYVSAGDVSSLSAGQEFVVTRSDTNPLTRVFAVDSKAQVAQFRADNNRGVRTEVADVLGRNGQELLMTTARGILARVWRIDMA